MSETTNLKLFKQDNPTTNTNNFDINKKHRKYFNNQQIICIINRYNTIKIN